MIDRRQLGSLEVSAQGLGCLGMSELYGAPDQAEAMATLERAFELGVTFLDTADIYGLGANEELICRAIRSRREDVQIATKFGVVRGPDDPLPGRVDGRPEHVREACDGSLQRLGVDVIDLYYQHRVDPEVPIEETIGAVAELIVAGKVRHVGLSEASADEIRRAAATYPIAALQSEWSLWCREIEDSVVPTCRELGIGIVPFSPLGRGFRLGGSSPLTILSRMTSAGASLGSRARTSTRTSLSSRRSVAWLRSRDARPGSWRWPGSRRKGTRLYPSPGRRGVPTWKRTSAPWTWISPETNSRPLMESPPGGRRRATATRT